MDEHDWTKKYLGYWSLAFGLAGVWFMLLFTPMAVVLAVISLHRAIRVRGFRPERICAMLGLFLGCLALMLLVRIVSPRECERKPFPQRLTKALGSPLFSAMAERKSPIPVLCAANLRQIAQAMETYAAQNKGAWPLTLDVLPLAGILPDANRLRCPGANPGPACDYLYFGKGHRLGEENGKSSVLVGDRSDNHCEGGVNVLLGDGRIESCPGLTLEAAATKNGWSIPEIPAEKSPAISQP